MLGLLKKRPDAADAATRLLILKRQVVYALATPPVHSLREMSDEDRTALADTFRQLADRTSAELKADHLWRRLTRAEKEFFSTPGPLVPAQHLVNALWRTEAAGCLMWSLGLVPSIPAYDTQFNPEVLKSVGASGALDFIASAALRPTPEIESQRDLAELWHWRSRTRQLHEQGYRVPADPQSPSLEAITERAAQTAYEAGEIPPPIAGDFPIFGKAYRAAADDEWSLARSIAMERHFAFNWLCGYAPRNRWADTPTDT